MLRVPAPVNVSLACAAVPLNVIAPVQLIMPVETDTIQLRPLVLLPGIAMLPAFNVPVPTAIVLLAVADGEFIVIAPETVRLFVPLMVIPLLAAVALGALILILAHAAATSTVTVTLLLMVTVSAEVGGPEPPHVALSLQLPVTEAVYAVAWAGVSVTSVKIITSIRANKTVRIPRFMFMLLPLLFF